MHQHHLEGWVHVCRLLVQAPHSESLWPEMAPCSSLLGSGIPAQASLPPGPSRSCLLSFSVAFTLGVSLLASLGACVLRQGQGQVSRSQPPVHTHTHREDAHQTGLSVSHPVFSSEELVGAARAYVVSVGPELQAACLQLMLAKGTWGSHWPPWASVSPPAKGAQYHLP